MKLTIRKIAILGILAALAIILKNLTINIPPSSKIAFHNIPIMIVSIIFNPVYGVLVVCLADIASIFTTANWNPIFIIPQLFWGIIPGLFFLKNKKFTWIKFILVEYCTYLSVSTCNFFVFWILYDLSFSVGRLPNTFIIFMFKAPFDIILFYWLFKNYLNIKIEEMNF